MKPFLGDGAPLWMAFRTEAEAYDWLNAIHRQFGVSQPAPENETLVPV